jgi:hypothetical protein
MANEQIDERYEDEELVDLPEVPVETQDNTLRGYEDYVNQTQEETQEEPEDELPEKYRGKSISDIVAMHQNAEKLLGKQSSEVGELRKVVDDFIQTQTIAQQQTQAPATTVDTDFDEVDFFEDPKRAVNQLLENHPSVKQSKEMAIRLAQQEAVAQLKSNHPDYGDIVKDQKFLEWVSNSRIRTELLRKADSYDYESANELFSLWKERQNIVNEAVNTETQARKQAVRSASTGNTRGSSEQSKRKIYRRADIVELMTKDPERYQALASEIRQAYAEGRVK